MTHPIIKAWQRGETDTGGCIAGLERENAALRKALHGFVESFDHGEHESWERVAVARKLLEGHSADCGRDDAKDAARYRALRYRIRAGETVGDRDRCPKFLLPLFLDEYAKRYDLFKGSVAGHLDDALDHQIDYTPHRALPCKGCNGKGYRDMGLEATGVECSECEGSGESHREGTENGN